MNDRDRLIELIEQAEGLKNNDFPSVEEIADHVLADGWIRMPCKVGNTVWFLVKGFDFPFEAKVNKLVIQQTGIVMSCGLKGYYSASCMITDFGKTVFFSKSQAEEALKGREEK